MINALLALVAFALVLSTLSLALSWGARRALRQPLRAVKIPPLSLAQQNHVAEGARYTPARGPEARAE
jgi:hypothetical protein